MDEINTKKYIIRHIEKRVRDNLYKDKIIIVYGPRQVGKTTMVKNILKDHEGEYYSCDDPLSRSRFENKNTEELLQLVKGVKLIVIDEAQMVENIGITLKLLHDNNPKLQIIATGSSSFDLANKIKEPLTGRAIEYILLPPSISEIAETIGAHKTQSLIGIINVYGSYPGVLFGNINKEELLINISNQYLYKDLLKYESIRKPELLEKLLKVLATSVGSEISYTEIANTLDVHKATIETYISYLEQAFIIYKVLPYSINIRTQISKKRKIYFYDNGIRNAILGVFDVIDNRIDKGHIFENFVFTEYRKVLLYKNYGIARQYFLRTYDKQEVDMIVEDHGVVNAYEIKWKEQKLKIPSVWKNNFKDKNIQQINYSNCYQFLV